MNEPMKTKPPTWFWIIAGIALAWNLMGVMAFFGQITITPEDIAKLKPEEQALYANIPSWVTIAFFLAVFGGALGCILLLLKKSLALQIFIISMVGIVVQMVYNVFLSGALDVYGPGGAIMPVMILIIGIGLIFLAKHARNAGWVS